MQEELCSKYVVCGIVMAGYDRFIDIFKGIKRVYD